MVLEGKVSDIDRFAETVYFTGRKDDSMTCFITTDYTRYHLFEMFSIPMIENQGYKIIKKEEIFNDGNDVVEEHFTSNIPKEVYNRWTED